MGLPALGVTGAAVATVAGQMTACSLAVLYFFRTNPGIHITLPDMRPDRSIAKRIYAVGVPSGLMTAMPSLLVGILNALLVELHARRLLRSVYISNCKPLSTCRPTV